MNQDEVNEAKSLDAEISKITKSTRATVPAMTPLHDILRQKYPWYYRWHLNPLSKVVHTLVLGLWIVLVTGTVVYSNVYQAPTAKAAADFTCTWDGTTGNWSDTAKWGGCNSEYPGQTGTTTYDVSIPSGSVTLDVASVDITAAGTTAGDISVVGTLNTNGNALTLHSMLVDTGGTLVAGISTFTVKSNWNHSAGTFIHNTSTIAMTGATGSITTGTDLKYVYNLTTTTAGQTITFANRTGIKGVLTVGNASSAVTLNGNQLIDLYDNTTPLSLTGLYSITSVQMTFRATSPLSIPAATYGVVYIFLNATNTISLSGTTTFSALDIYSAVDSATSTLDTAGYTVNTVNLSIGSASGTSHCGKFIANNSTVNVSGNVLIRACGAGTAELDAGSSTINVGGDYTNNSTFTASTSTINFNKTSGTQTLTSGGTGTGKLFNNLTHSGAGILRLATNDIDVNGTFTNSAGTFDADTNDKSMNFAGAWNNTGSATFSRGSGMLYFDGATTLTDSSSNAGDLGVVYITPTCVLTLGSNAKMTSVTSVVFLGNLNMGSGNTLTLTGTGTPMSWFDTTTFQKGTNSTVTYTGTTTATNVATVAYNNLTLTPTAATTYSLAGNLTGASAMSGNLTINANATLNTTTSNYGISTINLTINGTLSANASAITLSGSWNSTTGHYNRTSGSSGSHVTMTGTTGTASINFNPADFWTSTTSFNYLEINAPGNTVTLSSDITFWYDCQLNLQSGTINGSRYITFAYPNNSSPYINTAASFGASLPTVSYIIGTSNPASPTIVSSEIYPNLTITTGSACPAGTECYAKLSSGISANNLIVSGQTGKKATLNADIHDISVGNALIMGTAGGYYGELDINSSLTVNNYVSIVNSGVAFSNKLVAGTGTSISVANDFMNYDTFEAGTSTITFNGSTTNRGITTNGDAFYNLTIDGAGGGWIAQSAVNVTHDFNITNGTFDLKSGSNYALNVGNDFIGNNGTWTFEMRASTITVSGNWNTSAKAWDSTNNNALKTGTSTVVMNGTGTKTITTGVTNAWESRFYNLTVGQSGNTTSLAQAVGTDGVLTVGTGTFSIATDKTIYLKKPTGDVLSLDPAAVLVGVGTGHLSLHSNGTSGTLNLPAHTYDMSIWLSGGGFTVAQTGDVIINGNLMVNGDQQASRVANYNTGNHSLTISGNLQVGYNTTTYDANKTFTAGSSTVTVGGNMTQYGILTAGSSTFDFNSASSRTLDSGGTGANQTFNNLTHSGNNTLQLVTNSININGNLTNSAGEFDANGLNVDVAGNWDVAGGGFYAGATPGTQTVTLDGAGGSTQAISGSTTFNNLTATTATARTLQFAAASTTVVEGVLTMDGAAGQLLSLRSSSSGSWWYFGTLNPAETSYLDIQDSDASLGATNTANTSNDSGNNQNWVFGGGVTYISGTVYTNENKSTNVGAGITVAISVNGGAKNTITTTAGGVFSFNSVGVAANNTLTIFTDDVTYKSNLVTQVLNTVDDITGLEMYTGDISLRHETAGPLTNTLLATADNLADPNMFFSVDGSNNATFSKKLWVESGYNYTPGGNVTVNDSTEIRSLATLNLGSSGYILTLGGTSATPLVVSGTLSTGSSSTVKYTAVNAGSNVSVVATPYNNLQFSPASAESYDLAGNLTVANAMTGSLTVDANATLNTYVGTTSYNISCVNGTVNASGTLYAGANGSTGTSTFTASGNWDTSNGTFTYGTSTVVLTGTANLGAGSSASHSLYNLTMTTPGQIVTLSSIATKVYGTFTVGSTSGAKVTLQRGGGNAWFYLYNNTTPLVFNGTYNGSPGYNIDDLNTVYNPTLDTSFVGGHFGNLYFTCNNKTITLANAVTATGNLFIYSSNSTYRSTVDTASNAVTAGTLNLGQASYTSNYATLLANASTITAANVVIRTGALANNILNAGSATINVSTNWTNADTFTAGTSTVNFNGTTTQTITGANTWYNLTIANTAGTPSDTYDVDPTAAQTVTNTFNINDGQWSGFNGDTYNNININYTNGTVNGIFKPDAGANINISSNWTQALNSVFTYGTSTITFTGSGKTIGGTASYSIFYNITINPGASVTNNLPYVYNFGPNFTANGTFTVGDGKYVGLYYVGGSTVSIGDGGLIQGIDVADSIFNVEDLAPTVNLTGTGNFGSNLYLRFMFVDSNGTLPSLNYKAGKVEAYGLYFTSGTYTITPTAGTLDIDGDFSIMGEEYDQMTSTIDFNNSNNTTINIGGSFSRTDAFGVPEIKYTKGTTDTVTFDAAAGTKTFDPGTTSVFNNLTHSGAGTLQLANTALNIDGNFSNSESAGEFDANGLNINAAGNWDVAGGGFYAGATPGTQTVTLDGAGGSTQAISGSTTFNNLTATAATARTLQFEGGQLNMVSGTLTMNGAAGQLLSLRSSSPGTTWYFATSGTPTTSYLDVKDSDATLGATISASNSLNSGNNYNWSFGGGVNYMSGTVYTNENKSTNVGVGVTVAVSVNGTAKQTTTTTAGGVFSFNSVGVAANETLTFFTDDVTYKSNLVTQVLNTVDDITGLEMYTGDISLRHETAGPITNTLLATADNLADPNMFFSVDGSNNATFSKKLWLESGYTYTPGGNATVNDNTEVRSTATLNLGSSGYILTLGGTSATPLVVSGTLSTGSSSTVKYTAVNAGGNVNVTTVPYNNLQFTPASAESYDLTGNLTVANAMTGSLTIDTNATFSTTASNYNVAGINATIVGTLTPNASTITLSGNWDSSTGTVNMTGNTSTVEITGNSSINGKSWVNTFYNLKTAYTDKNVSWTNNSAIINQLTLMGTNPSTSHITGVASQYGPNLNVSGSNLVVSNGANMVNLTILYTGSGATTITPGTFYSILAVAPSSSTQTLGGDVTCDYVRVFGSSGQTATLDLNGYTLNSVSSTGFNQIGWDGDNTRYGKIINSSQTTDATINANGGGSGGIKISTSNTGGKNILDASGVGPANHTINVNMAGNWTNNDQFIYSNSTVKFTGTGAIDNTASWGDNNKRMHSLIIEAGAGTVTLTNGAYLMGTGTLTLNSGILTGNKNIYVNAFNGSYVNNGISNFGASKPVITMMVSSTNPASPDIISGASATYPYPYLETRGGISSATVYGKMGGNITSSSFTIAPWQTNDTLEVDTDNYSITVNGWMFVGANWATSHASILNARHSTITVTGEVGIYSHDTNPTPSELRFDDTGGSLSVMGNFNFDTAGGSVRGIFTPGHSTVTFNGANTQAIIGANTWYNLTIANTAGSPSDTYDVDPTAAQTVTNTFNINDGQYSAFNGDSYNDININYTSSTVKGIFKPDAAASVTVSGNWSLATSATFTYGTSTIIFTGSGKTIGGTSLSWSLYSLVINPGASITSNTAYIYVYGTTFTVNGTFSVNNISVYAPTVTVNSTLTVGDAKMLYWSNSNQTLNIGDGGLIQGVDVADSVFRIIGDATPTINLTGTGNFGSSLYLQFMIYYGDLALPSLNYQAGKVEVFGSFAFESIVHNIVPTAGNLDIDWDLSIKCELIFGTGTPTMNLYNSNNTPINIGGSFTRAEIGAVGAIAKYTKGTTDTVTFDAASGTKTFDPGSLSTFNNVTHSGAGTLQLANTALNADGNLTNSAGTFDANGLNINVAGNFDISGGSFSAGTVPGTQTVTLDGAGGSTQAISGSTTFNNLTASATAARTLQFAASSTTAVSGTLTMNGATSQLISLRSSSSGTAWNLNATNAPTLTYVDAQDSNASGGALITANNSNDSGNNTNWTFGGGVTYISGTVYTNENKSTNVGAGITVAISVDGEAKQTTTTTTGGVFAFNSVGVAANNTLTLFTDDVTYKGNLITQVLNTTNDITGLEMYTEDIVIRHETVGPMTNTLLATAATLADPNMFFSVSGGNATFTKKLWLESGFNYTSGGQASVTDLETRGTSTFAPQANSVFASGNWTISATGILTTSGTIDFTKLSGTQTLNSGGTDSNHQLYGLTHSGAGTLQLTSNAIVENNTFTNSDGTFDTNNLNTFFLGDWNNTGDAIYSRGSGILDFVGTSIITNTSTNAESLAGVIIIGTATLNSNLTIQSVTGSGTLNLGSGSYTLTVTSTGSGLGVTNFNKGTGSTVVFTGTGASVNIATFAYNNLTLSPATSATYSLTGNLTGANAMSGNLTINTNATLDLRPSTTDYSLTAVNVTVGGVLDAGSSSSTVTVGGNWDVSTGTFTRGTSIVAFTGSSASINCGAAYWNNQFWTINFPSAGTTTTTLTNSISVRNTSLGSSTNTITSATNLSIEVWNSGTPVTNNNAVLSNVQLTYNASGATNVAAGNSFGNVKFFSDTNSVTYTLQGDINAAVVTVYSSNDNRTATLDLDGHNLTLSSSLSVGLTGNTIRNGVIQNTNVTTKSTITSTDLTIYNGAGNNKILANGTQTIDFNVAGNWTNSDTFTAGASTVTFNGTTTQTITGANTWYNLTIANTYVTPSDTYDVDPTAAQTVTNTFNVNDGQYSAFNGDSYNDININYTSSSAKGILKPDAAASITVSGNWTYMSGATITTGTSTFTFTGSGKTIGGTGSSSFYNFVINPGASITGNATSLYVYGPTFTVNGTFNINSVYFYGATLTVNSTLTVGDGKIFYWSYPDLTLSIGDGGLIQGVDVNDSIFEISNDSTPTINLAGTGNFGSNLYLQFYLYSGSLSIPSLHYQAGKVEVYGSFAFESSTHTVVPTAGTLDIDGNFSLKSEVFISGTPVIDFNNSNNTTINIGGNFSRTEIGGAVAKYTKGTTDTVTFDAASDTKTFDPGSTSVFNNVTHSGESTLQLVNTNLNVDGNFTNSAGTFDANGRDITVAGSWSNTATFDKETRTVTFDGGATGKTINGGASGFYNLTINGAGGGWTLDTSNLTTVTNISINSGTLNTGTLSLGTASSTVLNVDGGNLNGGSNTINAKTFNVLSGAFVSGSGQVNLGTNSSWGYYGHTSGTADWTTNNTTLYIYSNSERTLPPDTYHHLTLAAVIIPFSGDPIYSLTGATVLEGNLEILGVTGLSSAQLSVTSNDLTVYGNLTIGDVATLSATTANILVGGDWTNSNTFTPGTSIVDFTKSVGAQTLNSGGTGTGKAFNNLTHSGAGTLQLSTNAINIDGNFTNSNGVFNANGLNVNVAKDWNISVGSFSAGATPGDQTVTFDSTSPTVISGSTDFNNLTMDASVDGAKTITFEAGFVQTIADGKTWDLNGGSGKVLTLRSSIPDTAWEFVIPADMTSGEYIDVKDSQNNTNEFRITPGANCIDSGNNVPGWLLFPDAPTIGTPQAISTTAVRWTFTDTSYNEIGFKVYDAGDNLKATCPGVDLTYCDEVGLSTNTQYSGRYVVSYNMAGQSSHSGTAASTYTLADTPLAPTLQQSSSTSLKVIVNVNGNPSPTQFAISNESLGKYVQADGSNGDTAVWQDYATWGGENGITNTGLVHSTNYTYRVKARNGDNIETAVSPSNSETTLSQGHGDKPPSPTLSSTESPTTSPGATPSGGVTTSPGASPVPTSSSADVQAPTVPSNLRATKLGAITLTLAWDSSSDDISVQGYEIYNPTTNILVGTTANNFFDFSGLLPNTTYKFYVRAFDGANHYSPNSEVLTITTLESRTEEEKAIEKQGGVVAFLIMGNMPQSRNAGQSFPAVKLTAADVGGNVVKGYDKSVYFTSSDTQAKLTYDESHPYTFQSSDNGVHTFAPRDFILNTPGRQQIAVSDNSTKSTAEIQVNSTTSAVLQRSAIYVAGFLNSPEQVSKANLVVAVLIAGALLMPTLVNAFSNVNNLWPQLIYGFTYLSQMLGLSKRRRKTWGVIFNSQTGQPIPFSIVKLLDKNNHLVELAISDKQGRYTFAMKEGTFTLKVSRADFVFPSSEKASSFYEKVYTGSEIKIADVNQSIFFNIPLDPHAKSTFGLGLWIFVIRLNHFTQQIRLPLFALGMIFAIMMLVINFNPVYIIFLAFCALMIVLDVTRFGRVVAAGMVSDTYSRPLPKAIVRIYHKEDNRLISTDISNKSGRFKFKVNPGVYYLVATRPQYVDFKTHLMYLEKDQKKGIATSINIELRKETK
ncbi:MAG: fibronectin type III domain-containing protein [Patescibacteria group bacterium]